MTAASMDSPAPYEPRPVASWRTNSTLHSYPSTPSTSVHDYTPTSAPLRYTPELEALPPLIQSDPTSTMGTPVSPPASLCSRPLHHSLDFSNTSTAPLDPRLSSPYDQCMEYIPRSSSIASSRRSPPRSDGESSIEKDQEIAFLLRWFSEGPGNWMDLFDLGTYFSSYVPAKACENPLLKYAACACAAKSLARATKRQPAPGGNVTCFL